MISRMSWMWLGAGVVVLAAVFAHAPALVAAGIGLMAGLSLSGSI
jgi:hypothetical protein